MHPPAKRRRERLESDNIDLFLLEGNRRLTVFVHGLGGNSFTYWRRTKDALVTDPLLLSSDFAFWGYPTRGVVLSLARRIVTRFDALLARSGLPYASRLSDALTGYRMPKTEEIGATLLTHLMGFFKGYRSVALFGHSLGGLIAQACIVEALKSARVEDARRISTIGLCATPTAGCQLADLAHVMRPLLGHNAQIEDLRQRSDFRLRLQQDFLKLVWNPGPQNPLGAITPVTLWCAESDEWVTKDEVEGIFGRGSAKMLRGTHSTCIDMESSSLNFAELRQWLLSDPAAVGELGLRRANERDPEIRYWFAVALGKSGDESAIHLLRTAMGDPDDLARSGVVNGLAAFGSRALAAVLDAAESPRELERLSAAKLLHMIGGDDPSVQEKLSALRRDRVPRVRRAAHGLCQTNNSHR